MTEPSTVFAGVDWPLHTARLTIRPAASADLEPTWQYRRLEDVAQWISAAPQTIEQYAKQFMRPDRLAATLIVELDGRVIGDLMLEIQDAWAQDEVKDQAQASQAEIGWTLDPEAQGRGYATEAIAELMRVCFEDLRLRRVIALCFADNEPSWRLMERLGMRREQHTISESLHRTKGWLDGLGYALLADEWRARRS